MLTKLGKIRESEIVRTDLPFDIRRGVPYVFPNNNAELVRFHEVARVRKGPYLIVASRLRDSAPVEPTGCSRWNLHPHLIPT